jgi:pullulanase/glycogen debranching enzyme
MAADAHLLRGPRHNPEVGVKDVTWLTPNATEMEEANWNDPYVRCFGMMLDGRAQPTGIKQRGTDETLLIVMNAHDAVVNFQLTSAHIARGSSFGAHYLVCRNSSAVPNCRPQSHRNSFSPSFDPGARLCRCLSICPLFVKQAS